MHPCGFYVSVVLILKTGNDNDQAIYHLTDLSLPSRDPTMSNVLENVSKKQKINMTKAILNQKEVKLKITKTKPTNKNSDEQTQ